MLFPALAGRETYIFHRVVGYGRMVRSGCSCGIAPALGAPVRTGAHVGGHNGAHVGAQNGAPKRSASRDVCPRRTDAASYVSSRGLAPDEATGGHVRRRLRTRAPSPETRILRPATLRCAHWRFVSTSSAPRTGCTTSPRRVEKAPDQQHRHTLR